MRQIVKMLAGAFRVLRRTSRSVSHVRAHFVIAAVLSAALGCSDAVAPKVRPPYLAIVTNLNLLPGVVAPSRIHYRVTELSGTLGIDTSVTIVPGDTVIIPVPPATYTIELIDMPATCFIRDGKDRSIVLSTQDNTGLIRYQVQCRGALNIESATDGYDPDDQFIYRLQPAGGADRLGTIKANDTLVFNDIAPGTYTMELANVAPNCVVTSDGGARQTFSVDTTGGVTVAFRVQCARESDRPSILSLKNSYVLGSSVFVITASDPTRDIDGYSWDITDCNGTSVLPDQHQRLRRKLSSGRTRLQDTVTIVGAYDVGLPDDSMRGRCLKVYVFDAELNTSEVVERPIGATGGRPPQLALLNARLIDNQYVETTLSITDPDNDFVGFFGAVQLRDGTLSTSDGQPDYGIMDPAGYVGMQVPHVPTTGAIQWDDVYSVVIWAIDAQGNAIRVEDGDLFQ